MTTRQVDPQFKRPLQAQVEKAEGTQKVARTPQTARSARTAPLPRQEVPNGSQAAPGAVRLHFTVNGVRSGSEPGKGQNKLSAVAYFRTKGCVEGKDRLTTPELIRLLQSLGVSDPLTGGWKVTLPNGVTVETEAVS